MTDRISQLATWIRLACVIEVLSPKPGNVNLQFRFDDASVLDFLMSADAIAPVLARSGPSDFSQRILDAVHVTRSVTKHNTNLGIILLIAPLAAVPVAQTLPAGIGAVLSGLTVDDSIVVYEAIRAAAPGGLGNQPNQDIRQPPDLNLRQCMALAADRDLIAAQYAGEFEIVLQNGISWLTEAARHIDHQPQQVTWLALKLMQSFPDSLIFRKCGMHTARHARRMADEVLSSGWPHSPKSMQRFALLDQFLRGDHNKRNPGTTADLVAAILFAALRDGHWVADENFWNQQRDSAFP